jgi:ATP-binding cassette subfamily B protein
VEGADVSTTIIQTNDNFPAGRDAVGSAAAQQTGGDLVALARRPLRFVFRYIRGHGAAHLIVLLAVVAGVACSTLSQYAVKHLVDVLSSHQIGAVWWACGLLGGLILADNMSWRVGGWVSTHCFVAVTGDMRRDLFRHLTGHAPSYFAERQPGTLAGRITATANAIFQVENTCAWNVLPPCLAVVFSIAMLASISPLMAGVLVVFSTGLGLIMARMAGAGRELHHTYARQAAAVDGELADVINNMPLVRAFGATLRERDRFSERVEREMVARGQSLRYLEKLRLFHALTTAVLTAGLLVWVILLWQQGSASTGDVVLVTTLGFTILHGTRDLAVALVDTVQHVARLSEALGTLLLPHDMQDAADARRLERPRGRVDFEAVTYAYDPGRSVLRDFTLHVEAGTRLGLVGRSGSGKSTVLALLQRMRDAQGGRVLLDGVDVGTLTEESLHAAISVVPQDVSLFYRSVRENIRYGRPEATDAEVLAAAEAAGCTEFIAGLAEGYDTLVGDRGTKLSGGQRQRLAIARAFLRDAPILLLDEATSALDSESEQAVQAALERLMKGRTVIAVAHRLSTLQDFDRIVVMRDGVVVQDGTPGELESRPGPYRELLARQNLRLVDSAA